MINQSLKGGLVVNAHALAFPPIALVLAVSIAVLACGESASPPGPSAEIETVLVLHPSTWFEDAWRYFEVSPDASRAVYGPRFGVELMSFGDEAPGRIPLPVGLENARLARFSPAGEVYWFGSVGGKLGWYLERDGALVEAGVPPDRRPPHIP